VEEVTQEIARSAVEATHAYGAFVETIASNPDGSTQLIVRGASGTGVPQPGSTRQYEGSFTESVIAGEATAVVTDLATAYAANAVVIPPGEREKTIVLPIRPSYGPVGALFILGARPAQLADDDMGWANTITHLAALAYEKVHLLDEAHERRAALERLMKSRQRLLRGFSHDVKNPLGAADGYADLLSAGIYGELTDQQSESVLRIRRSIRRALDLIDDLHELARTETGNIELHRELVDLGELARSSADEYRGAAFTAGLPLTVDIGDDIPLVETDSARIRQIVGNLLSNAIKYTETGAVSLHVRRSRPTTHPPASAAVDIQVTDTGIGIAPDKQAVIFEEFSRLGVTDKPGAGLGLAISERLAEILGGGITVSSEVGSGSTFTLRIPVVTVTSGDEPLGYHSVMANASIAR
jgi:signal transduction histidine kinase